MTDTKTIQSRILKTELINWKELKFIQQDNFKELSHEAKHSLKASVLANSFTQPFYIWEDENTQDRFCLDGKHRTIILNELINEGIEVPYLLPATFIHCNNKKEAARLVLIFSSTYAKVTQEGLFDFIKFNDLELTEFKDQLDLPDFSFDRFDQKFNTFDIGTNTEQEITPDDLCEIIVKKGDLFKLGDHRLICGSFDKIENLKLLFENRKGRILMTDPPYNLSTNSFSNKGNTHHNNFAMGGGEMSDQQFMDFISKIMKSAKEYTVDGSIHYIFMDWRHCWHMTEAANKIYGSYLPKQLCVWNKDIFANGSFYRSQHELCFIFKSGVEKHLSHIDLKDRIRTNIWSYPSGNSLNNPDRKELSNHPTPKPVSMIADAIIDSTNEHDYVIDFFLGSGTTLIACEQTNRRCIATEIEEKYVQLIIKRYLNFCTNKNKIPIFEHINGSLTLKDFENANKRNT